MIRATTFFTSVVAVTAVLGACSDGARPSGPYAATFAHRALGALECKPAPADSLIPLPIAPRSKRVDLGTPIFSNPTRVSNPLFPISNLSQVVLVGFVGGVPFRAETTLLPGTQPINFGDHSVETLTSQYVGYLDRRLDETALDWYGQDDDGAVWYFGEDVSNYDKGRIIDKDGTWIACKDGPVAMIMPAVPQLGNVYRVENLYPNVFEEIEVIGVDQTVDGPLGQVTGAFTGQQLHLDGSYAPKQFAPGYGEFSTGSGTDVEALAVAIPIDGSALPAPSELRALLGGARRVFDAAGVGDWARATKAVIVMNAAWARYSTTVIPRLLKPLMANALSQLTSAVANQSRSGSRQFALDVGTTGLDLLLQHRSRIDVDFARIDLWARQLIVDTEARDAGGAASDLAILKTIVYRLSNVGSASDRRDASAAQLKLGSLPSGEGRRGAAAALDFAGGLQSLVADRVRELERQ